MLTNILVGDTIRIQVTFRDWSTVSEGAVVDPLTVTVDLLDADLVRTPEIEVATKVDTGVYYFDWTPLEPGIFYIEFVGTFEDGKTSVVREQFSVVDVPEAAVAAPGTTLMADQEFSFVADLQPIFVDPEEFKPFYTEASQVEVLELIYRFSLQVQRIFGDDQENFPEVAFEYIRASVLCALSKIYGYGLDGDANSLALGDLKISSQAYPRNRITRANAANWCELAAVLLEEMRTYGVGMKAVVKGTRYKNPMPKRHLKSPYGGNGRRF